MKKLIYETIWLICSAGALRSYAHIIRNIRKLSPKSKLITTQKNKIVFIITARQSEGFIQEAIDKVHDSCKKVGFQNYEIKLVVDKNVLDEPLTDADIILVPKDYPTYTRFKARALQYALTQLPNKKDIWFFHLDEDTLVTPQCVERLVEYSSNPESKPIASGAIIYCSKIESTKNVLLVFMEAHRMWTHYWLQTQLEKSNPIYINGSNLFVRSDVEQTVGWDFGASITEDSRFAIEAKNRLGNVFGWHGGIVYEQPPASIMASFRQRRRWFAGGMQNLKYVKSKATKATRIYSNTCWILSFPMSVLYFVAIAGFYHINPLFLTAFAFTRILWYARYQLGMYQILKYTKFNIFRRILYHAVMLLVTPITDMLSSLPCIWALVNPPKTFEVTTKKKK